MTSITDFLLDGSGYGGIGGAGGSGDADYAGQAGASGGTGQGGYVSLAIYGAGATLDVDPITFQLYADAIGGAGGRGGSNFAGAVDPFSGLPTPSGGQAGDGGTGGSGYGGTLELLAGSGTTMTLLPNSVNASISASGTGGQGGAGGDFSQIDGGIAGNGGDGGVGYGGSPTLTAIGGTITGGDLDVYAVGTGGAGGIGGGDTTISFGANGNGGIGVGGNAVLQVLDGSPGILQFGNVSIFANGVGGSGIITGTTFGGRVDLRDLSVDPLGLINFASLTIDATGNGYFAGAGFYITGGSGPISVAGNLQANVAGDIVGDFANDGQLRVGGNTNFNAGGGITITHLGNPGIGTIDTGGSFSAFSGGSFTGDSGSSIRAGGEMFIIAGGDITGDDLLAVPVIFLQAAGSVYLNNAQATGPQGLSNVGGIVIDAGLESLFGLYNPGAKVEIYGNVLSYSDITITSGGTVQFFGGSSTVADNALLVRSGDDIIVDSGASLGAAANPTSVADPLDPFASGPNLSLLAGYVTNLLSIPGTPIASVKIGGSLDAHGGAVILTGNAVDALNGTVAGSSLAVDINDAPAPGITPSDDAGLLDPACLQGSVCLGNILADNRVEIGQASNNGVIQLIVQQGTVNADTILITTRNDVVMGTNGIDTTLNAASLFSVESTQGNIDLRDASIARGQVLVSALNGSLLGTASLNSAADIGISVGDSIQASSIVTGGELTTVANVGGAAEGSYSVPGTLDIGTLSVGNGPVNYSAGADLLLGTVIVPGTDIILDAGGNVALGATDTANNISITALGNAGIGDISSTGSTSVTAASIALTSARTTGVGAGISLRGTDATQTLSAGSLATNRGDILVLAAGDLVLGSATTGANDPAGAPVAGTIALLAGGNIDAASGPGTRLVAGEDIALSAGGNATLGSLLAGDDIDISAGNVVLSDATTLGTGSDLFSIVFGGTISFAAEQPALVGSNIRINGSGDVTASGTLDAANNIAVVAGGTPSIANAVSSGDTSITGQSVTFSNGTVGGNLTLIANAGDIDGSGMISVGGGILMVATGDVTFGTLNAQGDDFVIDAGGDVLGDHAEASGNFDATAGGSFTVGPNSIVTGGDILVTAVGPVVLGNSSAGGLIDVEGSQIDYTTLVAGGTITLDTLAASATAGGNGNITGGDVTAGTGGSRFTTTAGDIALSGVASSDGDFTFTANGGSITLGTSTSAAGVLGIVADGSVTMQDGSAGENLSIGGASLVAATLDAGERLTITTTGAGITADMLAGATGAVLNAQGDIASTSVTSSGGNITAIAANGGDFTADVVGASQSGSGQVGVSADGPVVIGTLVGNGASLTSNNGAVTVSNDIDVTGPMFAGGTEVSLLSTHDLRVQASATAGSIDIATDGSLVVNGASATDSVSLTAGADLLVSDDVSAANALNISALGLADFEASAVGATISVFSADITIGSGGAIGRQDVTSSITFNGAGDMFIGGSGGATTGYQLDNGEFAQVHSGGDILVTAPDGAITIGDLGIVVADPATGSGNIGLTGGVYFDALFGIDIVGQVAMGGATADNTIGFRTDGDVFLDAETGLVEIANDTGYTGQVSVSAQNFYAMTAAALADIGALDIAGIDARLANSDGMDNPDGVIRTGTLDVATTASDVFIQNTVPGTGYADRRGITVDTLTIADTAGSNQPIVINGVIGGQTGLDAIPLANLPTGFDPGSTINGCLIGNVASCSATTTGTDTIDNSIRDLIDDDLDPGDDQGEVFGEEFATLLIEMRDPSEYDQDPLIDDPVTGAGNEDLWEAPQNCDQPGEDGKCPPSDAAAGDAQ
ncbi:MAG: hypothetical protein IE921_14325 [Rhodobacteraceae bacterium]|nr:hypothetical protein [Paracoccaceae bacterium]